MIGRHFLDEPCEPGCPPDCPVRAAVVRREKAQAGAWSPLVLKREFSGFRHYLDGKAVTCGTTLELQSLEDRYDEYDEYTACLQRGVRVRYEASLCGPEPVVTLYFHVDGHNFTAGADQWMRFRWPQ